MHNEHSEAQEKGENLPSPSMYTIPCTLKLHHEGKEKISRQVDADKQHSSLDHFVRHRTHLIGKAVLISPILFRGDGHASCRLL